MDNTETFSSRTALYLSLLRQRPALTSGRTLGQAGASRGRSGVNTSHSRGVFTGARDYYLVTPHIKTPSIEVTGTIVIMRLAQRLLWTRHRPPRGCVGNCRRRVFLRSIVEDSKFAVVGVTRGRARRFCGL